MLEHDAVNEYVVFFLTDEVEAIDVENPAPVQCVNPECQSLNDTKLYAADADMSMFYKIEHKKKAAVCEACANLYYKHLEVFRKINSFFVVCF